ncbi:hypothetical protein VF14_31020 [Nostoc linckia z18]|uniref:Uncharacterized protein n=2 Tax=Nostoc linckia TaxID=92942 RepID=A0A9Q5Z696_NOSLI|nr:hypothetical protein [Nostoc linckia]PHK30546.1 hypothetical protein VF12_29450 [Nostoc linckia z15]PHK42312.1 hypothetical protein VF13_29860 [Nostoc linckia z16]PHJ56040.1 hypothetical protein VF02_34420 [Nostoc linckia z1]PHJ67638.1 hypothetical protein VF05_16500 [Nostoc linckia z3]PHJ77169.1 hypothetical protein VF03_04735 [Nostoc linckia z2]
MKTYKIKYWDNEGQGTTLIDSSEKLDADEAANLVQEQLRENGIDTSPVQVEEFREVKNPLDMLVANIQRLGFGG